MRLFLNDSLSQDIFISQRLTNLIMIELRCLSSHLNWFMDLNIRLKDKAFLARTGSYGQEI